MSIWRVMTSILLALAALSMPEWHGGACSETDDLACQTRLSRLSPRTTQLLRALKHPEALTRSIAVGDLEHAEGEREPIVSALAAALEDEDAGVRVSAYQSLGSYGPHARPFVPALRKRALKDEYAKVRGFAEHSLSKLGFPISKEAWISNRVAILTQKTTFDQMDLM